MNEIELRTILSGTAIIISVASLWFARKAWRESNRPIVSAVVETKNGCNVSTAYDLIVSNTGNRPAVDVLLHADTICLEQAFTELIKEVNDEDPLVEDIRNVFSDDAEMPVLLNGQSRSNSFGCTSSNKKESIWKYKSKIPIRITYKDLEGKHYESKMVLHLKDTKGFAGGFWGEPTTKKTSIKITGS